MNSVTVVIEKKFIADGEGGKVVSATYDQKVVRSADTITSTLTTYEFNGSDMTGSDGDSGRTYTMSTSVSPFAKVYLGSLGGGMMRLDASKWSGSGAVITIDVAVYDGDRVNVDQ